MQVFFKDIKIFFEQNKNTFYLIQLKSKIKYNFLLYIITCFFCYLNINSLFYFFIKVFFSKFSEIEEFVFSNIVDLFFFYFKIITFSSFFFASPFFIFNFLIFFFNAMRHFEIKIFIKFFFYFIQIS
jgi:Sec-independent protein secretion pathway component TatC